jgi:hypothetical protein
MTALLTIGIKVVDGDSESVSRIEERSDFRIYLFINKKEGEEVGVFVIGIVRLICRMEVRPNIESFRD